ncbi:hypothetical protein OG214_13495 [Streptomyces sp. NBC_00872]|nr:hypothetical protein OG214_13495 [Streptomyces sp. NBC_00872]
MALRPVHEAAARRRARARSGARRRAPRGQEGASGACREGPRCLTLRSRSTP